MKTLNTYCEELEELGLLRFQIGAVKEIGARGIKYTKYAMLNEDQAIFAATLSRNTRQVVAFKLKLTKAFSHARRQLQEQEQYHPTSHTLTDTFRPRALENLYRVPEGYFSVMGELFKHLYNLEALINRSLDENAMIEISVGLCWSRYAREVLGIPDQHRCKYAHVCHGGRVEQVWAYELQHVTTFDKWLWEVYFPQHFPDYERYRAKYLATQVAPKKRLLHPKNQQNVAQQASLFLDQAGDL